MLRGQAGAVAAFECYSWGVPQPLHRAQTHRMFGLYGGGRPHP